MVSLQQKNVFRSQLPVAFKTSRTARSPKERHEGVHDHLLPGGPCTAHCQKDFLQ